MTPPLKPILRKDARTDLHSRIWGAVEQELRKTNVYINCINCINFREKEELCIRANPPARPPARIIVTGCPAFEDKDEIPF